MQVLSQFLFDWETRNSELNEIQGRIPLDVFEGMYLSNLEAVFCSKKIKK